MTRDLDAANLAASQDKIIVPIRLVKLEFDSGDVLVHSRLGNVSFGGDTYLGVGNLGNISVIEEDAELARSTLTLTLSGIPSSMISIVFNENFQGRKATIYDGYLNKDTMQLVADPEISYRGRMDVSNITQGKEIQIAVTVESRLAAWDKPIVRRYNHQDQQTRFPGDTGFQFAEQAASKEIFWGRRG